MRRALVLTLCLLLIFALPALAETQGTQPDTFPVSEAAPSVSEPSVPVETHAEEAKETSNHTMANPYYAVEPVSIEEFTGKIDYLLQTIIDMASAVIVKVAMVALTISSFFLILGWIAGHGPVRKYGFIGAVFSAAGLLLFYSLPFVVRLIAAVANVFNS